MDRIKKVQAYIEKEALLTESRKIVAAVSGGIDSMVMAHILYRLRETLDFDLIIANFNHHLRPEADEEACFVRNWAECRGLHFWGGEADVALLAQGANLQDIARRERYAFLRRVAYSVGDALIATAHHRDDQAETMLLHLLRGSGASGLAGIVPLKNGVIRPLLCLSREEIQAYAAAEGIEFREDQSNFSTKYLRNRIRLALLPVLKEYNPQIVSALNDLSEISRAEDSLLDDMAEISFAELWCVGENALAGESFDALATALQRRLIRKSFCLVAGERPELSFAQVEAVRLLKQGRICTLPQGWIAYRRKDLHFANSLPELPVFPEIHKLCADGAWHALPGEAGSYTAVESAWEGALPDDVFALPAEWADDAFFRTRREGDRVFSSGKYGQRKLKDLFINAKIPLEERNRWPLLLVGDEILWVPGVWKHKEIPCYNCLLIKIK